MMEDTSIMERISIAGKECHIYRYGNAGKNIIFLGTFAFTGKEEDSLITNLQKLCKGMDYTLITYYVSDWNAEFSPWPAEDSNGSLTFAGKGPETLIWLTEHLLPEVQKNAMQMPKFYIAGYSLAGLFSLWAFYESGLFHGAACCSGSLWMDHWDSYIQSKTAPENTIVYLSLGGKEEKTKDSKMQLVGKRTRNMEKILQADPNVKYSILEWNKGGHFADSGKRLAKAIYWLLSVSFPD